MKKGLALALVCLLAHPSTVLADECRERIATMFDGGPLDPFSLQPHRMENTTYAADGSVRYVYRGLFENPLASLGGIDGGTVALIIGQDSWMGQSMEGPWTKAPNMVPDDHEAFIRGQTKQKIANLDRTACDGIVEMDGKSLEKYTFFTKTDPVDAVQGAWFGGMNTVYLEPDSGRVMRWEMSESVAHYQPEPSTDRQVNLYHYDPSIRVERPE